MVVRTATTNERYARGDRFPYGSPNLHEREFVEVFAFSLPLFGHIIIPEAFTKTSSHGIDFFQKFCYTDNERGRVLSGNAIFGDLLLNDLVHFTLSKIPQDHRSALLFQAISAEV